MGRMLASAAVAAAMFLSFSGAARADMPSNDGVTEDVPGLTPKRFNDALLPTGRLDPAEPEADAYRFFAHGEYQLRFQAERSFPLTPTPSAVARTPRLAEQSLHQSEFVHHWLRINPILQLKDKVELVSQLDLTGLVIGDVARDTHADQTPRDERNGFSNVQARWLYVQYKIPFGFVRVGQQPNHWGMGIVANDGDHATTFGDYRYGSISDRVLLAVTPGDVHLAIAGDLVFRDNFAKLTEGQQAFQGVLVAAWQRGASSLGIYSTLRHQTNDHTSVGGDYSDDLDLVTIDLHGRVVKRLPGDPDGTLFAEAEAAYEIGSTSMLRAPAQRASASTQIRAYGGAAAVGVMHHTTLSDLVGRVEVGYASGDANPYDGTEHRFTFDPNHRIGLLLFDEILRFQTARAATALGDPLLGGRTPALVASNGGVYGAQYINPTITVRPRTWFDIIGGAVIAQSTSDVVDPYRLASSGTYVNARGGDPKRKDLGLELDGGVEARIPLAPNQVNLNVGAQAGVLFPGGALADASGARMDVQWIAIGRAGVHF